MEKQVSFERTSFMSCMFQSKLFCHACFRAAFMSRKFYVMYVSEQALCYTRFRANVHLSLEFALVCHVSNLVSGVSSGQTLLSLISPLAQQEHLLYI